MSYPKTLVDFDVLTYNVRGLGDERKRRKIFNYTVCPIKKVSIKNFYSELLKASIHSF